ncbi:MAG: hypothetical protein R3E88_06830 [Myxococcota bacterium]
MSARRRATVARGARVALAACVAAAAGCASAPYYVVESRLVQSARFAAAPDVTASPAYRELVARVARVGVRLPDVCADRGISAGSGDASFQQGVLRTRCGVEMAQLERALTKAGYEVVSWDAVQQKARREEKPVLAAARELRVDVLLQVNALERVDLDAGRDARWERRYYRATRTGERRDPARVAAARADRFEELVRAREERLLGGRRIAATINVSAIWVETGAAIWFYEWTHLDDASVDPTAEVLVRCEDERCEEVVERDPAANDGPREGSIVGVSTSGDPADEGQAIFHALVREVVTDLAERFAGRRG